MRTTRTNNNCAPHCIDRSSCKGMVLVLTLWILAILSLLLLTLTMAVKLNTEEAVAFKRETSAEATARGAANAVARKLLDMHLELNHKKGHDAALKEKLMKGKELGFYLVKPEKWQVSKWKEAEDFSGGKDWLYKDYAVCYVCAEDAKAPINRLKEEGWLKIPSLSKDIVKKIKKLLKSSGNRFLCKEQLLCIEDLRGGIYDGSTSEPGLKDALTALSSGKLFINRASAPAIAATLNIDLKKAASIANRVKNKVYFYDLQKLGKVSGVDAQTLGDLVSLICKAYRIKVFVIFHGHVQKLEAVFVIGPDNSFTFTYIGSA